MPQERVLGSFIVRVIVRRQQRLYSLHDLRTGASETFKTAPEVLEAIERSSTTPRREADP